MHVFALLEEVPRENPLRLTNEVQFIQDIQAVVDEICLITDRNNANCPNAKTIYEISPCLLCQQVSCDFLKRSQV